MTTDESAKKWIATPLRAPMSQGGRIVFDPNSPKERRRNIVKELNLDVGDTFTNLMSHALALADERDDLRSALEESNKALRERDGLLINARDLLRGRKMSQVARGPEQLIAAIDRALAPPLVDGKGAA